MGRSLVHVWEQGHRARYARYFLDLGHGPIMADYSAHGKKCLPRVVEAI